MVLKVRVCAIILPQVAVKQVLHTTSVAVNAHKAARRSDLVLNAVGLQPSRYLTKMSLMLLVLLVVRSGQLTASICSSVAPLI
jgi:hypothetical protein